jgi:hypothetical protein
VTELFLDSCGDNILHDGLGPIPSNQQMAEWLTDLPRQPGRMVGVPRLNRLHQLIDLTQFHLPPKEDIRVSETIDLMIRSGYRNRDPAYSGTMAVLSGEAPRRKRLGVPALAAAVEGPSGSGKTESIRRSLARYPRQVIRHETFPQFLGPHSQVVWLSVDVPSSGKAEDLARALMTTWQRDVGSDRFAPLLTKERFRNPLQALEEWRQVAIGHFLGFLHLDEVQNFFKLDTLERRRRRADATGVPELSIIEDHCLKWVLTLLNTWGIPVMFSGTPDGIGALTKRLSNMERFATGGYHAFGLFESASEEAYRRTFLGQLAQYQYVTHKLDMNAMIRRMPPESSRIRLASSS